MNKTMITAVAALFMLAPNLADAKAQEINQQLEIPANARVVIDTMRGEVDILGADTNLAKVTGKLDVNAEGFIFELAGDTLTIKVKMPKRGNFSDNDGNDLVITLPKSVRVDAQSVSADFDVENFAGNMNIRTVSGDVDAKALSGAVAIETVSGDIEADKLAGEIMLKSVSGDVSDDGSDSPRATYSTVSGDIEAKTNALVVRAEAVSGDVKLVLASVDSLHVNSVSGDVELHTALNKQARVNIETVSGSMQMKLAGALHADINANANAGGKIINRLNDVTSTKPKYGPGESLSLQLGERSGSMRLSTVSGDIELSQQK
ncbi:DUF4097 family beta strand repeat-containing protein [Pseudidiomarina woesei]|uniref:DUF4097 domain-containing protein n=1 Tax=Pseudidiomarina woesei TaxID=1381080 RepID=A0A0K6H0G8_9GAMM|nr:DUF4097 family beta strand repeat-containing protein [Pseudidiomarina woesei]CUA84468.1 Domain of unknown function (DUF4098) [Pseudidiomarina woesei]